MTNYKTCLIGLRYGQFGRLRHIWFGCAWTDAKAACLKMTENIDLYYTRMFLTTRMGRPTTGNSEPRPDNTYNTAEKPKDHLA